MGRVTAVALTAALISGCMEFHREGLTDWSVPVISVESGSMLEKSLEVGMLVRYSGWIPWDPNQPCPQDWVCIRGNALSRTSMAAQDAELARSMRRSTGAGPQPTCDEAEAFHAGRC